jgi:hypothetical protein
VARATSGGTVCGLRTSRYSTWEPGSRPRQKWYGAKGVLCSGALNLFGVENLVGLRVSEVNVTVNDVQFPEERPMLGQQQAVVREARKQEMQP